MSSQKPLYRVRRSDTHGRGVFAARRIRPGQRIIEYAGERISNAVADRRYDEKKMQRHHTYLFTLDTKTVIDGHRNGNHARYINHSCDPNCEAVTENDGIWIYALKNIQPGVELAYDYAYPRSPGDGEKTERFYKCECGSRKCRGTILAPKLRRRKRRTKNRQA